MSQDEIYANRLNTVAPFEFNQHVATVFPDMIQRSVPGYPMLVSMFAMFAQQYLQQNSCCYDLGCSLGAATLTIYPFALQKNCNIIAVDNSEAMIEKCQKTLSEQGINKNVTLSCADILDIRMEKASMIVMNYTLQFIPLAKRQALLNTIYQSLLPGGVFIISEKVSYPNASQNQFFRDLHEAFKKQNGYSDLEISQKRTALENVLIPETIEQHQQRIIKAGFKQCDIFFQCFNFLAMACIK